MAQSRPLRVLIVDDYPDGAEATAQLLGLLGHETRSAQSCAEALAAVDHAAFVPDVVLVDIRLPDGNGFTLGGELRRLLPAPPVLIAISGLHGQEDNCRAAGFNHYLLKPADPAALAALLARYVKTE